MKMRKLVVVIAACTLVVAGCSGGDDAGADTAAEAVPDLAIGQTQAEAVGEAFADAEGTARPHAVEPQRDGPPAPEAPGDRPPVVSGFFDTATDRLSTFAMDVDTASWTYARSWIDAGQLPAIETVRPEEFVNSFAYGYPAPEGEAAWGVHVDGAPTPWNDRTRLVRVGLNTRSITPDERPDATLVFVVDVSGSMEGAPIATVKDTLTLLASRMRPADRIGIVTYGDTATVVLPPTPLSESDSVAQAIGALTTGGSTYAEEGLRVGYEQARAHLTPNGVNAVVLASDGVANVGATGPEQILATIRAGVDAGISLLALGIGGNDGYNDHLMETLTNTGNGTSYYVTGREEAERLFVDRLEPTLVVVARDSKVQVEFEPARVTRWRLIGYDNRDIADEDFRDDTVDAGEVGAGHEVTAMYEVELAEGANGQFGTVNLRWAHPKSGEVTEVAAPVTVEQVVAGDAATGFTTAAQAIALAEVLRASPHVDGWTLQDVAAMAGGDPSLAGVVARAAEAFPAP